MSKRFVFAALASLAFVVGAANAGIQTPKFGLTLGDLDPVIAKPGTKICPKDGSPDLASCTLPFIKACNDAGGTSEAVSTNGGPNVMSCK